MKGVAGAALLLGLVSLTACDGREESAIDNLANGANASQMENNVRAEAQALMEPLAPPAPGTPGGLPDEPAPLEEGAIDPDSAQGAAQVVLGYYGLLEEKRFGDAQDLWNQDGAIGAQDDAHFAARFRGFSEIHANIGSPAEPEEGEGATYVTVPVQVYGRLQANGKPWYRLRQVLLRRVDDGPDAKKADRRWHIESIGAYVAPPAGEAENATQTAQLISATDGLARKH